MPPRPTASGYDTPDRDTATAASLCADGPSIETLKNRRDFVAAARARRVNQPGFVLQARKRRPDEAAAPIRVGFTCSKKVGNAVARNRAKRRLREIARLVLPNAGVADHDYVLVGRRGDTASIPFLDLCDQLRRALKIIHARRRP